MEEKFIEQPEIESETNSEIEDMSSEQIGSENQDGSIYGKFKDAKTLLDAYNSLQGEFTRKSQKLSEFQKKFDEFAFFSQKEELLEDVLNGQTDSDKYKKEIEEMLAKNENISNLPNKYRVAFETVKGVEERFAQCLNSQDFYDKYVKNNEKIKGQVIDEYLSKLNNISSAPKIISASSTSVHFTPIEKPKTMKEAGEIFSKMLK